MERAARLRRKCMTVVVICYLLALAGVADALIPFIAPSAWSPWRVSCVYSLCEWRVDEVRMLPPAVQTADSERAEVIAYLQERTEIPRIRASLIAAELVRLIPEVLFLVSLALGFRRLGKGEVLGRQTIVWLRRAAAAALLFAVAQPVTVLAQWFILLSPLTGRNGDNMVTVYMPVAEALAGLILASAAWAIAFALEEGSRKQDELAAYV